MKTDSLSYRFFKEFPDCFFELVGRPAADARRYHFDAIELKDTAVRIDGLYLPQPADEKEPAYFVEYQNHRSERTYSNLLLKVGLYLEKVNPRQNWHGVVIYPSRSVEQENLLPYRWLLRSDQLTRIYLEDLREFPGERFGFSVLRLIGTVQRDPIDSARRLIERVQSSPEPAERQRDLIELIETVVWYQRPDLSRKEIEKMLQVEDIRQTRVYQEAVEEGIEKGIEQGIEKGIEKGAAKRLEEVTLRMLARKMPLKDIADITGLSVEQIKKLKKKHGK